MNATTQEKTFCSWISRLFPECIIWVYAVARGFGTLFYCGADIPISSRLVPSPPRPPTSFTPSNICKWNVLQLTLYTIPFKCSFVGWSLGFLKAWPSAFSGLKAVLSFSQFKIRIMRYDTPLIHGIDAYAFGFSRGLSAALFGWRPTWWSFRDSQ